MRRLITRSGWLVGVASLLVASCAPLPPPTPAPVPPSTPAPAESVPVPVPTPTATGGQISISVGLAWDLDSLTLDPIGAAQVQSTQPRTLAADARLTVVLGSGGFVARGISERERWEIELPARDTLWLWGTDGPEGGPARFIRWKGRSWRGMGKVFVNPRGRLTLALRLPLEDYLLGVIPGEIGPLAEERIEAGRAQAIAARSYTLFYRGRRGPEGFDLYGTVEDQVYGPVEDERPLASRCVTSTAGEVALSGDRPIRANYSSTCGGITCEVWEAWPTPPMPYLVSHVDRGEASDHCLESPHYRWREEWSAAEFLANLRTQGPTYGVRMPPGGPGELLDVRAAERSRSGRVWRLVVETSRGSIVIPAYSLRQMLRRPGNPAAILRSTLFKVDVRRDPRTRRALSVVASGAGSGHGVGLCQTGALGMAQRGAKADAILRHYYRGITLTRVY